MKHMPAAPWTGLEDGQRQWTVDTVAEPRNGVSGGDYPACVQTKVRDGCVQDLTVLLTTQAAEWIRNVYTICV